MHLKEDLAGSGLPDARGGPAPHRMSCLDLPLAALMRPDTAMAVIVGVAGPSYRPVGAAMAVGLDGRREGSLSSGCVEHDISHHAVAALRSGRATNLRYGAGSPFRDLQLPCGGGLDVLIVPRPDARVLASVSADLAARRAAKLAICRETGALRRHAQPGDLCLSVLPRLRFLIFGKGPEAQYFAGLVQQVGYEVALYSPEPALPGIPHQPLPSASWPQELVADDRSAVTLFFHDHDWEPPLLSAALQGPAFYVGAQGSLRAAQARRAALSEAGVPPDALARLQEPFGLIPSARDPRSLAVSVLADVLSRVAIR